MIEKNETGGANHEKTVFGTLDGVEIMKYTLTCGGMEADIVTYGATLTALRGEIWDGGYSAPGVCQQM